MRGHVAVIKALLQKGAAVDAKTKVRNLLTICRVRSLTFRLSQSFRRCCLVGLPRRRSRLLYLLFTLSQFDMPLTSSLQVWNRRIANMRYTIETKQSFTTNLTVLTVTSYRFVNYVVPLSLQTQEVTTFSHTKKMFARTRYSFGYITQVLIICSKLY